MARNAPTRRGRVVSYEDVVREAVRHFVRSGGLDVRELTAALAISRATLYRVIDDQDRLLGDALWVLAARTLRLAEEQATGRGVDRLMDVGQRFHAMVQAFGPLQRFTEAEPERAFRVLFTAAGGLHERTVARWTELFHDAAASGEVELPFDAHQFAEMFVRLGESMLWPHMLTGSPVDEDVWRQVQRSLFSLPLDPA